MEFRRVLFRSAWPADRQSIEAGTLTITAAQPEERGACRDITFDPTILPDGIALSDDPLLAARSAAYASSFGRRAVEAPGPSAVGKTLLQKGRCSCRIASRSPSA